MLGPPKSTDKWHFLRPLYVLSKRLKTWQGALVIVQFVKHHNPESGTIKGGSCETRKIFSHILTLVSVKKCLEVILVIISKTTPVVIPVHKLVFYRQTSNKGLTVRISKQMGTAVPTFCSTSLTFWEFRQNDLEKIWWDPKMAQSLMSFNFSKRLIQLLMPASIFSHQMICAILL